MKQWLKRITGLDQIQAAALAAESKRVEEQQLIQQLESQKAQSLAEAQAAQEQAELAKMTPKEQATRQQQPWVAVLDTKVNPENVRNGFFELDWNQYFIQQLIDNGYGTEADPEEEVVDRWFRDIVYNMFAEEGLDTNRGSGYINVVPIAKGKSQVS
jgi:hypothetical protein